MKPRAHRKLRLVLLLLAALLVIADGALSLAGFSFGGSVLTEDTAVHFIDVGQGDATLLLSGGDAVLIDAGEASAGDTVVEYLRALGVKKLYAAVATHPHADHIGGMAQVVDAFPIDNFYMGPETANTAAYDRLLTALEKRGIRPIVPEDGDTLRFRSDAALEFLGPAPSREKAKNLNDRSLITRFVAGEHSVLLMGDAEAAAEKALLSKHPRLSCEVLKVGHHGSATSSIPALLRAVHPSVAVISCGQDNDFGHPAPDTLQNLKKAGVSTIHITAEEGAVILPFDQPSVTKENAA